jgi:hypothetical protein
VNLRIGYDDKNVCRAEIVFDAAYAMPRLKSEPNEPATLLD